MALLAPTGCIGQGDCVAVINDLALVRVEYCRVVTAREALASWRG